MRLESSMESSAIQYCQSQLAELTSIDGYSDLWRSSIVMIVPCPIRRKHRGALLGFQGRTGRAHLIGGCSSYQPASGGSGSSSEGKSRDAETDWRKVFAGR